MKRIAALCLTLILMLSALPLTAFAASEPTHTMLKPNDLSDVDLEERGELGFWHQLNVKRQDVKTITFLDSTESAPQSVLDFSADADMSVIGWIVGGDVFVAADGKIALNETSSYLYLILPINVSNSNV